MKALVAAGGNGTRLRPLTFTHNKQLIPIANKPTIQYGLENILAAGITDVIINVNPGDKSIEDYFGDGNSLGLKIQYVEQIGGPLGLAHIILNAAPYLGDDDFVFYLGDNIFVGGIEHLLKKFYVEKLDCVLALARVPDPERFGVPEISSDGKILRVLEKPKIPPSDFAVTGVYVYNHNVLEAVQNIKPSKRGELEISDAHTYLIEHEFRVGYEIITGWWKDTGKPQDLLEGNQLVLAALQGKEIHGTIEANVLIEGAVRIGKGTIIKNGEERTTVIRGPVVIGENCWIENAHIAPYTSLGNHCRVVRSEVAHSILFDGVSIEVEDRVVDSIIGKNATVVSARNSFPIGHRLVIGDNSSVEL